MSTQLEKAKDIARKLTECQLEELKKFITQQLQATPQSRPLLSHDEIQALSKIFT
jgi:hypothetical protein